MIVITGAAGFIGSCLGRKLNFHGIRDIALVDDFTNELKRTNWEEIEYVDKIQRDSFFPWADINVKHIDFIFHLGARTDYYSMDSDIFETLNTDFSQRVWSFATVNRIPLIFSSSYLTLNPQLNSPYAKSKYFFDKWIEKQQQTPPFWAGLKIFQVYGKKEGHKGVNASNVYKIYKKYLENETLIRVKKNIVSDYIYVNDVVKVLYYFINHTPISGIYELGTGFARPLQAIIDAVNKEGEKKNAGRGKVEKEKEESTHRKQQLFLEYDEESGEQFQADLTNLRKYVFQQSFLSLEEGVKRVLKKM